MHCLEELSDRIGVAAACAALQVPRASFYRWQAHKDASARSAMIATHNTPSSSSSPRALKPEEREGVLEQLRAERFVDLSPREIYATLLDEGLCSVRTLYRLLEEHGEVRERRDQHTS